MNTLLPDYSWPCWTLIMTFSWSFTKFTKYLCNSCMSRPGIPNSWLCCGHFESEFLTNSSLNYKFWLCDNLYWTFSNSHFHKVLLRIRAVALLAGSCHVYNYHKWYSDKTNWHSWRWRCWLFFGWPFKINLFLRITYALKKSFFFYYIKLIEVCSYFDRYNVDILLNHQIYIL